jgi:hypothetical protein
VFAEIMINILASAILLVFGFFGGKYRERKLRQGKQLEEYEFYPFDLDDKKVLHFDATKFAVAVRHLLTHRDDVAARQLVLIGEQNDVGRTLPHEDKAMYRRLYQKVGGDKIIDDNIRYLEALYVLKNNVTGRNTEAPATNLVLDLKTRGLQNQDKLNYELNIGARRFKCTTIPIYRENVGLVGAICINVDVNFLQEDLRANSAHFDGFINSLCKTDMTLDENILSKDEYAKALVGKRHFRDFSTAAS